MTKPMTFTLKNSGNSLRLVLYWSLVKLVVELARNNVYSTPKVKWMIHGEIGVN